MIETFRFNPADDGSATEWHAMIHCSDSHLSASGQMEQLHIELDNFIAGLPTGSRVCFRRYFLSDAANQTPLLQGYTARYGGAVSVVQQPPLDGTKVALWVYATSADEVATHPDGLAEIRRGNHSHLWLASATAVQGNTQAQTETLLTDYARRLADRGLTLRDNCVRTWFFVPNIDAEYGGVVVGRNNVFAREGLTPDSHFIASTGIGGRVANASARVSFDAYAVGGLASGQMKYLYAKSHLNPTYEYGVSFERGACVDYADRRHVYISGTASINNKGEIVHEGDIRKQTERMLENISALLGEAEAAWTDVAQIVVYLRDIADYGVVNRIFGEKFSGKPMVFVYAPVCRPGWLIETECMAIVGRRSAFGPF